MRMQADELRRARLELDSLKKQYTQKDMFEKEILGNHQKTLGIRAFCFIFSYVYFIYSIITLVRVQMS